MKETVIKSIAAIICVVIICLTLSSAISIYGEAELEAAQKTAVSAITPDYNYYNNDKSFEASDTNTSETDIPKADISDGELIQGNEPESDKTTQDSDNPAEWTTEKIVEEYKKAALKSHPGTKSQHKIKIEKIKVNEKEFDGITSLMDKLLANNSEDKDGITGGYENLTADDIKAARAYTSGGNTIIEMDMKDQVAGPREGDKSGSVGHAVTVVGDISSVTKQITDLGFPLKINEKETNIYYTKATVKVVINQDGKIINGTWQYTVEISLKNYTVLKNTHVDSTSILMTNTLTVNDGFKK